MESSDGVLGSPSPGSMSVQATSISAAAMPTTERRAASIATGGSSATDGSRLRASPAAAFSPSVIRIIPRKNNPMPPSSVPIMFGVLSWNVGGSAVAAQAPTTLKRWRRDATRRCGTTMRHIRARSACDLGPTRRNDAGIPVCPPHSGSVRGKCWRPTETSEGGGWCRPFGIRPTIPAYRTRWPAERRNTGTAGAIRIRRRIRVWLRGQA